MPDRSLELEQSWFDLKKTEAEPSLVVQTVSLHELLVDAFDALRRELSTNGNTPEFLKMRQVHGDQLRAWWNSKRVAFIQGQETGEKVDMGFESWVRIGNDESVNVSRSEDYATDAPILTIGHRTSQEENEVTMTAADNRLDLFMYPPKITCKYREVLESPPNYNWEVIFRGPAITTFTRTIIHEDPSHRIPYIKQTEVLDAAIFGIDRLGMLAELG